MPTPKIQVEDGAPIDGFEVIKLVAGAGLTATQTADDEKAVITFDSDLGVAITAAEVVVDSATLVGVGVDAQAVFEELDNGIADHLADASAAHAASAISVDSTTLVGVGTDAQAVFEELDNGIADHLADTADAHDASAISLLDTGAYFAAADVEAAFLEHAGALTFKEATFTETAGAGTYTATVTLPDGCVISYVAWRTTAAWDAATTVLDLGITGSLTLWGNDINVDAAAADTLIPDPTALGPTIITTEDFVAAIVTTGAGGTTGRTKVWVAYFMPVTQAAAKV